MSDIAIVLRVGLALVFLAAAGGKVLGDRSPLAFGAATVESGLSALLLLGLFPVVVALLTATACIAYLGDALIRTDERCNCFGSRLPSTSRAWQRARNTVLTACSITYCVVIVTLGGLLGPPSVPSLDAGLAVAGALLLIALPWLFDWTFASESSLGPRANS